MKLRKITLSNFRSYPADPPGVWSCEGAVNILVGENSAGKTNFFRALRLALQAAPSLQLSPSDRYMLDQGKPSRIGLEIEITREEAKEIVAFSFGSQGVGAFRREKIIDALGPRISVELPAGSQATVQWGPIKLQGAILTLKRDWPPNVVGGKRLNPTDFYQKLERAEALEEVFSDLGQTAEIVVDEAIMDRATPLIRWVGRHVIDIAEVRGLPAGQNSPALVSPTGERVADVLVNLKNSPSAALRRRFEFIQKKFREMYPNWRLDVTKSGPMEIPEVRVETPEGELSFRTDEIGSGIAQIVTILAHVVGTHGFVILIDTPESNLHPLAVARVKNLLRSDSDSNQFLVATHSPHFLDPDLLQNLTRVIEIGGVSQTFRLQNTPFDADEERRIGRDFDGSIREMFFARALLFVEGDTELGAIPVLARSLGIDPPGIGLAVVSMDGRDWYLGPKVARAFGIPSIVLLDNDALTQAKTKIQVDGRTLKACAAVALALKAGLLSGDQLAKWVKELDEEAGALVEDLPPGGGIEMLRHRLVDLGIFVVPGSFDMILRGAESKQVGVAGVGARSKAIEGRRLSEMLVEAHLELPAALRGALQLARGAAEMGTIPEGLHRSLARADRVDREDARP